MISHEAAAAMLGISGKVELTREEMADKLNITFYPSENTITSEAVRNFAAILLHELKSLKCNVVPFKDALEHVPLGKRINRAAKILIGQLFALRPPLSSIPVVLRPQKIKRGIAVVVVGEVIGKKLPIEDTTSFTENTVISILDFPAGITEQSDFAHHFDSAMNLFSRHMSNIVIGVDSEKWVLYNFNASHPIFKLADGLREPLLSALIPKIVAPIRPARFKEFNIVSAGFDLQERSVRDATNEIVNAGILFDRTALYPKGRSVDSLPFRTALHRWIGKLHLDFRNGMSYGFMAKQLPLPTPVVRDWNEAPDELKKAADIGRDFVQIPNGHLILTLDVAGVKSWIEVPPVHIVSQRSGSDKTHLNPRTDLLVLGIKNGQMTIATPRGVRLNSSYKPSFDTRVMLANAIANSIVSAISKKLGRNSTFVRSLETSGMGMAHWHGYISPSSIPDGYFTHGENNPHVACSSPQSAIYALLGKLLAFKRSVEQNIEYVGDIHIEPHHGTNISYHSLTELAKWLISIGPCVGLGNLYLSEYR